MEAMLLLFMEEFVDTQKPFQFWKNIPFLKKGAEMLIYFLMNFESPLWNINKCLMAATFV